MPPAAVMTLTPEHGKDHFPSDYQDHMAVDIHGSGSFLIWSKDICNILKLVLYQSIKEANDLFWLKSEDISSHYLLPEGSRKSGQSYNS